MIEPPLPLMVSKSGQAETLQTYDPAWLASGQQGLIQLPTTNWGRKTHSDITRPAL
jgi:hypothetical protein